MTTYFVKIQHKLAAYLRAQGNSVEGWRIIEYVTGTHESGGFGLYLVEDDNAPADLEGKTVEPVFGQRQDVHHDRSWVRDYVKSREVVS